MQVVLGVQDQSDAAVAVVKRLQNVQAARDLDLVIRAGSITRIETVPDFLTATRPKLVRF